MTVLVLGGGLIGVTTAYYLAKAGHAVTVVERNAGPGEETSFQNGALLAPGHSHSWAAPGATVTFAKSLFQRNPALKFRMTSDPQFWRWARKFLSNCTHERYRANTLRVFRCMNAGLRELRGLADETGIGFDQNDSGILYLFRSQRSFDARRRDWELLQNDGLELEESDVQRCIEIEPSLEPSRAKIGGGFYSPNEAAGDAFLFTQRLTEYCANLGVKFLFGTTVIGLEKSGGVIVGVQTSTGELTADAYVLALGPEAPLMTRPIGLDLPIWPVKGYTVSVPISDDGTAPTTGLIEEDNLVAFANLGGSLRLGGKADFAGYDRSFSDANFTGILSVARDLFPTACKYDQANYWACLRPVTAGGPPILGETPVRNLFVNVGHGAAGWTEACATSKAVAAIMDGAEPDLDMTGLRLADL